MPLSCTDRVDWQELPLGDKCALVRNEAGGEQRLQLVVPLAIRGQPQLCCTAGDLMLIKKYGNRRLYDVDRSRYITLAELAELIQTQPGDVQVLDAKNGEDLTTATLAQIIVESRGAARLLPKPLLLQLIRMRDDSLAEFLGQYVTWALEAYLQAKQGMQSLAPFNPFLGAFGGSPYGNSGFGQPGGFSRMFGFGSPPQTPPQEQSPPPQKQSSPPTPPVPAPESETAQLRRELDELKQSLKKKRR